MRSPEGNKALRDVASELSKEKESAQNEPQKRALSTQIRFIKTFQTGHEYTTKKTNDYEEQIRSLKQRATQTGEIPDHIKKGLATLERQDLLSEKGVKKTTTSEQEKLKKEASLWSSSSSIKSGEECLKKLEGKIEIFDDNDPESDGLKAERFKLSMKLGDVAAEKATDRQVSAQNPNSTKLSHALLALRSLDYLRSGEGMEGFKKAKAEIEEQYRTRPLESKIQLAHLEQKREDALKKLGEESEALEKVVRYRLQGAITERQPWAEDLIDEAKKRQEAKVIKDTGTFDAYLIKKMGDFGLTRANFRSVAGLQEISDKFRKAAKEETDTNEKRKLEVYAIRFADEARKREAEDRAPSSPRPSIAKTAPTTTKVAESEKSKTLEKVRKDAVEWTEKKGLGEGIRRLQALEQKIASNPNAAEIDSLRAAKFKLFVDLGYCCGVMGATNIYYKESSPITRTQAQEQAQKTLEYLESDDGKRDFEIAKTKAKNPTEVAEIENMKKNSHNYLSLVEGATKKMTSSKARPGQ